MPAIGPRNNSERQSQLQKGIGQLLLGPISAYNNKFDEITLLHVIRFLANHGTLLRQAPF